MGDSWGRAPFADFFAKRALAWSREERGELAGHGRDQGLSDGDVVFAGTYVHAVDGIVLGNDLGTGLNVRNMSLDGLLPTAESGWFVGVFKRVWIIYSHVMPKHARALAAELLRAWGGVVVLHDKFVQSMFKDVTAICKAIYGVEFLVGDEVFNIHEMSGFTDINRFVGYNASMPPKEEAVAMAHKWLVEPRKLADGFRARFQAGVSYMLRTGGAAWRPNSVRGPTLDTCDEWLPALMTDGAGPSGLPRFTYVDENGRLRKVDKTKAAVFGAFAPGEFSKVLQSMFAQPKSTITMFIKPDELGKTRHLAIDSYQSYLVMALWLHVVMEVLRGHSRSPLFHSAEAERRFREVYTDRWQRGGYVALPLDEGKFDEHKTKWQIVDAIMLTTEFCKTYVENADFFVKLAQTMVKTLDNTRVETEGVFVGMYTNGIASGWAITAYIDTIINLGQAQALVGAEMFDVEGQGDDTDMLVADLETAKAIVQRYVDTGFDVNAQKQSFGTKDRPITEFLRKVTSISGDILPRLEQPVVARPSVCIVTMTAKEYAAQTDEWRRNRIAIFGDLPRKWVRGDAHVHVLRAGQEPLREDEVSGEQLLSPVIGLAYTDGPSVEQAGDALRINPYYAAYLDKKGRFYVYGYCTRMLPKVLLRTPGAFDPKEWEVRAESTASNWMKMAARGGHLSAVFWLMVRDLKGMLKVSPEIVTAWLSTPAQMGGFGLQPFGRNWVQLMHPQVRARFKIMGYRGLLTPIRIRLGLSVDDAMLAYRRARGVPMLPHGEEWEMLKAGRRVRVVTAARTLAKHMSAEELQLAAFVEATTPAESELLRAEIEQAARDGGDVHGLLMKYGTQSTKRASALLHPKMGDRLFSDWVQGKLDMFKTPRYWCYAESWVSEKYLVFARRAFKAASHAHRLSRVDLEAAAFLAVTELEKYLSQSLFIWRD